MQRDQVLAVTASAIGLAGMRRRRWWFAAATAAVALTVVGAAGLYLFSRWTELATVTPEVARAAFVDARVRARDGPPYLEVLEDGSVLVHRDLEGETPVALRALNVMAWEPVGERLLTIEFPFWFVRLKMSKALNLGTLTTTLAGDWQNLDLRVSEEDLQRRGPGLVLDQVASDGSRILLWTE